MKNGDKASDVIKGILVLVVLALALGSYLYMCEIEPLQECEEHGHSLTYCYKLFNR